MSRTSPTEQSFALTSLGLVAYVSAAAHERIAAAADKAVWQMLGAANREAERAAKRAVRRMPTPALAAFTERLVEENHRRDCRRHGARERPGAVRLADVLGPETAWEVQAREELDARAAEWVRGLMALLFDGLASADVELFTIAHQEWRSAPESFRRYWMSWNHNSSMGGAREERERFGRAGDDYEISVAEFLPAARRLRAEDRAAAHAGAGKP